MTSPRQPITQTLPTQSGSRPVRYRWVRRGLRRSGLWLLSCLAAASHAHATGDTTVKADRAAPPTAFERTMAGVSEIGRRTIDRAVTRACRSRGVPDAQRHAIRDAVVDQWQHIMDPRDPAVRDLVLGYLSMRTSDGPPSPETVKSWSELAGTLLEKHMARLSKKQAELLFEKDPKRRATLELEVAVMSALSEMSRERVERWKNGVFDERVFWQEPVPVSGVRDAVPVSREPISKPLRATTAPPQDPISIELARWTRYVKEFIARFAFDDGQRDAAHSCLSELVARASAHRERYREEIAELERRMESTKTSAQIETDIQKDLIRLYGPIDDMFAELRARLDQIPTQQQKKDAAQAQKPSHKPRP